CTSAFTLPFGPIVRLPFARFNFPSTSPSTKRSSLPVTSPLIRMPWLMHAAAREETGSALELRGVLVGVALDGFGELAESKELSEIPCGLASSFFHIKHLDIEKLDFRSRISQGWLGAATQKSEDSTRLNGC